MAAGPWEEYATKSGSEPKPWEEYAPKSTSPIPDVVAPTVRPTSTPSKDLSRALAMPGVTTPEKTAWEKTKDFVTAPIINRASTDVGATPYNQGLEARLRAASGNTVSDEQASLPLPRPTRTVGDVLDTKGGGVGAGIARGAGRVAAGLTSPMNLAMLTGMGALPKLASAGVNAAFTVEQAMQLPEQAKAIKATYDDPNATSGDVAQAVTELGLTTGLGAMGARGMANDIRTSPQVQRRMAPKIASDFDAALDLGYAGGMNRATRAEGRDMVERAAEGTQARLDKFGIVPRPLPPPQGGVVVDAPNRPPLAAQLADGNERTAKLLEELDKFANPPKPVIPSRELPPRTPKSAADSAAVFDNSKVLADAIEQPVGPPRLARPTPGLPPPLVTEGLPPVRLTDEGAIIDPSRTPTPIRRSGGPDDYPLSPLPPVARPIPAKSPRPVPQQAEVATLPPPPAAALDRSIESSKASVSPEVVKRPLGSQASVEPSAEPNLSQVPAPGPRKEVVQPESVDAAAPVAADPVPGGTWQDKDKLRIRTEDLEVDPVRFQYKVEGIGQGGVTNELKDVDGWNDDAAGTIFVWKDPANGKTYVVNGHHRYDLAKRVGQPDLGIKYIDAPDAQSARAAGALQNIREGKGSSIDAAKFLRDTGKSIDDLKKESISLRGPVAKEGGALANLAPSIFDDVIHGNVDRKMAAIVGDGIDNFSDQKAMLKLAQSRKASPEELREMIRLEKAEQAELAEARARAGEAPKEEEVDLFGNKISADEPTQLFERSQLSSFIRQRLSQEKKLFGMVGSKSVADRLGTAGNKIEAEANRQISDQANQALAVYDKLSGMTGPITDLLREGAKRIANGEPFDSVKESIYGSIRDSVAKLLPGSKPANVREVDAGAVAGGDGVVQADPRQRVVGKSKKAVVRDPSEAGFWKPFSGNRKQLSPSELHAVEMIEKREAARRAMDGGGPMSIGQRIWAGGKSLAQDAKANVVDKASPIEDPLDAVIRRDKGTFSIRPSQELEGAISKVFRAKAIAGQFAKDNGLIEAIQSPVSAQDYGNFEQLLIARHAAELDPTISTGRDAAKDAQLVKDFTPKYQKELALAEKHVRALEDFMVSSGIKSQKEIDALRKRYPNYTDFHRVLPESLSNFSNPRGIASKLSTNIIQKLKGSDTLQIDDPLGNLLKKTDRVIAEGLTNQAALAAAEYRNFPGMESVIREVAPHTAKKMRSEDYFTYLDDGKPRYFVAPRSFVSAAKNLDEKSIGLLGQFFYSFVRMHKAGTTMLDLVFGASNFLRDQQGRAVNQTGVSKRAQHVNLADQSIASKAGDLAGIHPTIAKATAQSVIEVAKNYISKNSALYDEMVRAGGGGTSFDMFRNNPALTVKHIRAQKDGKSRAKNILTGGFRELENLIGMSEEMTRLQAFGITKADALASGMSQADAQALGGKSARQVTADFYRGGNWRRAMMAMYPYINANIQGTRESIRSAKADPVGYAIRTATNVAIPMAIATMWNLATPEREAAYADIQDWEKDKYFILLPENPVKDEKGRWESVKLPMPPGVSEVGGLVRRHMEGAKGGDPVNWKNYAGALFNFLSPVSGTGEQIAGQSVPHGPKIMAEAALNKNFYTNRPIKPEWMDRLPVQEQAFDSTSGTARMAGSALGVAPVFVDHVIKGLGGGVTGQVLHYADVGRKAIADKLPDKAPGVQYMRDLPIGGESTPEKAARRFLYSQGGRTSDKQIEETKKAAAVVADEQNPEKKLIRGLYKAWKENPDDGERKIIEAMDNGTLSDKAADKVMKMIESDDMEKWERDLIRQPIAVRAVAILKMIEGKSDEEIDAIEQKMEEKGILTERVAEEMDARMSKGKP